MKRAERRRGETSTRHTLSSRRAGRRCCCCCWRSRENIFKFSTLRVTVRFGFHNSSRQILSDQNFARRPRSAPAVWQLPQPAFLSPSTLEPLRDRWLKICRPVNLSESFLSRRAATFGRKTASTATKISECGYCVVNDNCMWLLSMLQQSNEVDCGPRASLGTQNSFVDTI